jgi:hypothetical protein
MLGIFMRLPCSSCNKTDTAAPALAPAPDKKLLEQDIGEKNGCFPVYMLALSAGRARTNFSLAGVLQLSYK